MSSFKPLNVSAILLSHAHLDHFGNMGLLNPDYPIIASAPTIALLKAILDASSTKLGSEVAYYSKKVFEVKDDRIIKSDKTKSGKDIGRNFCSTTKISDSLKDFMGMGIKSRKSYEEGNVSCLDEFVLNFEVESFEVDHSIYGSTAYIVSKDTTIAYTGDFRLHGKRGEKSKVFINHAKGASVLITEGTRASREDINESEELVFENCLKAAEESKGLVVADFSARNFERLETFQKIANKVGRTLIITIKDAYLLKALEKADGIDRTKDVLIYNELKSGQRNWEKNVISKEENLKYIDPTDISRDLDKFIVCFSLYDLKNLLDIKPTGGSYIYSSSEAFEEESEFDFVRLHKWLERFGFNIFGFDLVKQEDRLKPTFIKGFHASGHAAKSELIWAIETIDPDIIIPVHTDNPEWFKENFDNAILLKNGETYKC
jgi:ribonuclease J